MRLHLIIVALAVFGAPVPAHANGGPVDMQRFRPAIDSNGLISLDGSQVLGHLEPSFGLVLSYARRPMSLEGPAISVDLPSRMRIDHLATGYLQAALGLWRHFEVGLGMPLTFWQGAVSPDSDAGFDAQGAGDLSLHLKGRLLSGSRHFFGLSTILSLALPTGDDDRFLGSGRIGLRPMLVVDREILDGRLKLAVNLGAQLLVGSGSDRFVDSRGCEQSDGDCGTGLTVASSHRFIWGAGVALAVVAGRLDAVVELSGQVSLVGEASDTTHEILGGLKLYLASNSYFTVGVGRGLRGDSANHAAGSPDIRGVLGFVFEPRVGDRDGDGLKDDVDRCPTRPEDFDDFEDEDGCPDPDNDRDGFLDGDDRCPNEPETKNGFEDEDGCPDRKILDRDGDGIPDHLDKCPDEPEDKDGFEDEDGCPDPDNDRDGILDIDDLCPNDPEDKDGFEDKDGCPDPDNDRDGILDGDDSCPNEPETKNGYRDEDGCPDRLIRATKGKIVALKEIYFETNSARIRPVSFPVLNAVYEYLRDNTTILLVEIQGHADERGSHAHNDRLTDDRAAAVRAHLVGKGISANRLRSKGYGERSPVDRRHTHAAWSKNRRVDFVIRRRSDH